jgi:phosphohistidine phosphatase
MSLYVLRHASAGTSRPNPLLDAKRPLDKEGKEHCLHLAHTLNALKISFDLIVSSPLKRALQTAQLIATETSYEAQIVTSAALAPSATFAQFKRLVEETGRPIETPAPVRENILVVGHNPNISDFIGRLITPGACAVEETEGAERQSKAALVRLRKGSLARVALGRGATGTLQSILEPRVVRALYRTSTVNSRRSISRK